MIKAHKRRNSGYMRRSSRIFLVNLNKIKSKNLYSFLQLYVNIVRYYIIMFWAKQDFSNTLSGKEITDRATKRFYITARLSQLACKQAKEIINSQIEKSKRQQKLPHFKNIAVNLDSRFFSLTRFNGSFDWALKLSSGFPKIVVPFNNTKHTLKFLNDNWILGKSIRIGIKDKKLYIDLIFEKERPEKKIEGEVLGVDLGYRSLLATSNKQLIGTELKIKIQKAGKRRKSFHHYIQTETNRILKQLDLNTVKFLILENLKNVKKNKRGKFSRKVNRLLSFWYYAKTINRLRQICEEQGTLLKLKNPWKTSQRCPICGKIDRRNRKGEQFKCIGCGFSENADIVGALNLRALGLAGVYSLRSLTS